MKTSIKIGKINIEGRIIENVEISNEYSVSELLKAGITVEGLKSQMTNLLNSIEKNCHVNTHKRLNAVEIANENYAVAKRNAVELINKKVKCRESIDCTYDQLDKSYNEILLLCNKGKLECSIAKQHLKTLTSLCDQLNELI